MASGSWVQIDGKLVPKHEVKPDLRGRSSLPFPMVITDIAPYKSMVTGEMVTSRSQHREHLRMHNCVEVGNEAPAWIREAEYVERHGGKYTPPEPETFDDVSFEWQDPNIDALTSAQE